MTIIPACRLSPSELAHLGHNVRPAIERDREEQAAIQRSLAIHEPPVDANRIGFRPVQSTSPRN